MSQAELENMTLLAVDRHARGQPFTWEEVSMYFKFITDTFGETEASGFLNKVLDFIQKNYVKKNVDLANDLFRFAVVETIVESAVK